MLSGADTERGTPPEPANAGSLQLVAAGIYGYLLEMAADRERCREHDGTAAVSEDDGALAVTRGFQHDRHLAGHFLSAARLLSDGRTPGAQQHERRPAGAPTRRGTKSTDHGAVLRCDITWEHRPLRLDACVLPVPGVLRVDVIDRCGAAGLGELPLRLVAVLLRCHEFLLPQTVAPALPLAGVAGLQGEGVGTYLKRTMPQNLAASHLI